MNRPIIEQVVIDAVATMARRAVGDVHVELGDIGLSGEPGTTAPARVGPWVSIEWADPPESYGEEYTAEEFDLPGDALFTMTALAGKWVELEVNGVRLALKREAMTLADLRNILVVWLAPLVAGRVVVVAEGVAALRVTPVVAGDLWRVAVLAGATMLLGEPVAARVHQQLYRCSLLLTVLGGRVGSGVSGVAGPGTSATELAAALTAELAEEQTQLAFDAVPMRNVSPPGTTWSPRRVGSRREGRLQTYLELGLTARWCTSAKPATVPTNLLPPVDPDAPPPDPNDPPPAPPDTGGPDAVQSFKWVAPPNDPITG